MQHDFTVIIERDPESDWLVGSVTELPGCYTQAPTLAELESNMREAIEVYLETSDEDVRQMPWSTFVGLQRLGVSL